MMSDRFACLAPSARGVVLITSKPSDTIGMAIAARSVCDDGRTILKPSGRSGHMALSAAIAEPPRLSLTKTEDDFPSLQTTSPLTRREKAARRAASPPHITRPTTRVVASLHTAPSPHITLADDGTITHLMRTRNEMPNIGDYDACIKLVRKIRFPDSPGPAPIPMAYIPPARVNYW